MKTRMWVDCGSVKLMLLTMMSMALTVWTTAAQAQTEGLQQVQAIPLNGVEGRIDHMAISADGRRLFVAALGNGSVEVLDLEAGTVAQSIPGLKEPQGIAYIAESKGLAVACGQDANVRIFDDGLKQLGTVDDLDDADNARYDAQAKLLYVGYGSGALAVIDPDKITKVADIPLDAHPESFQLERGGNRIFVNVPGAGEIEVIDREKRSVIAKWPVTDARANFPMALDETDHRLFIGCRRPAKMLVLDIDSGKVVAQADCVGDTDDLFYDSALKRIYISGGAGSITVISQNNADNYQAIGTFKTASGARTSFFSSDKGLLYLAVPHRGAQSAEIRVYKMSTQPTGRMAPPLRPVQSIAIPQIKGGMNHMDADVARQRFFVTAPGDKLLAVIDLRTGRVVQTLGGYGPAAARFVPDLDLLCLSGNKAINFYEGESLAQSGKVDIGRSVDELQYDPKSHLLYAGITDAINPGVAIVDVPNRNLVAVVKLSAKPQGIVLNASGSLLYANTPGAGSVSVIDCAKRNVTQEWKLTDAKSNYPIAIDDKDHRLFVGYRNPARLFVLDADSGKSIASVATGADTDDMAFDRASGRIYLACGAGVISTIQQDDADHYRKLPDIQTAPKCRNCSYVAGLNRLYLAVPKQPGRAAELRVYEKGG